ncbi:MAG: NAD(P)-binding protein, partial [Desulfobacterales bacterium]|nr:NAD(P)-binding protein [Desulfobacterales bacterium]
GAYLAKQGIPVTVVEQRDRPGGYAASFDRTGGKYRFEVSLHGMYAKNNVVERILEDLG